VDVPDDDDGLARPRVDADEVGLLVEPGGGGDDQPLDDRRREHGRELVRGEVARAPVQSGGQPRHPVPRQPAVLGPLDRKRPKRREWGRIRRGGGAVGLRHGMRRIRRVGFGFLSSFCSSFFISSLFFWLQIAQMAWVCASLLAAAAAAAASTFFLLHPPISVCFGPGLQKLAGRKNWVVEHPAGFSQNQQNSDEFTEEH
jgi:hypothetical protein